MGLQLLSIGIWLPFETNISEHVVYLLALTLGACPATNIYEMPTAQDAFQHLVAVSIFFGVWLVEVRLRVALKK